MRDLLGLLTRDDLYAVRIYRHVLSGGEERDGELEDWEDLQSQARDARNERTSAYLLGQPLLADHLADGLSAFGLSCEDFERDHL